MTRKDTIIYKTYHEKATIEHHGEKYGVTARVSCNASKGRVSGDGYHTPYEVDYTYNFTIDSLEIFDTDGEDFPIEKAKELLKQIEEEVLEFCEDNSEVFYH